MKEILMIICGQFVVICVKEKWNWKKSNERNQNNLFLGISDCSMVISVMKGNTCKISKKHIPVIRNQGCCLHFLVFLIFVKKQDINPFCRCIFGYFLPTFSKWTKYFIFWEIHEDVTNNKEGVTCKQYT